MMLLLPYDAKTDDKDYVDDDDDDDDNDDNDD